MRPSGAIATLRGDLPTAISAIDELLRLSITPTESLSGLTTQILDGLLPRDSVSIEVELVGASAVFPVATACRKLRAVTIPLTSLTLSVTPYTPGLVYVYDILGLAL